MSFLLALLFLMPQQTPAEQTAPQLHEFSVFGGGSLWKERKDPLRTKLINGGVVGIRFTQNAGKMISFEQTLALYGVNNLRFHTDPTTDFGARIFQIGINPIFNLASRTSRVRPFVTVGYQTNVFYPTKKAKASVATLPNFNARISAVNLGRDWNPALNYGVGVKIRFKELSPVALRLDARGILSGQPRFGLASGGLLPGSVVIPSKPRFIHGFQPTAGLTFYFGHPYVPPPPPPPPPAPPAPPAHTLVVGDIRGAAEVCPGTPVTLSAPQTSMGPETYRLAYQWTVDGMNAATTPEFLYVAPNTPGEHRIGLTVRDDSGYSRPAAPITKDTVVVRVKSYSPPTVTASADRTDLKAGESAALTARGTASECGGNLTYSWTASEGAVTGGAQARFDSSNVNFDRTNRDRLQTKSVTVTATVRDEKGGTASAPVTLSVSLDPEARRFDDLVFAPGSSRVNNCGKRILLEEVYPLLTNNPNSDLVLVGHIDQKEEPKRRTARTPQLDRDRVMSAAGIVVTAGLETARVKTDWVGTDQSSEARPGFCGTSTRTKTSERRGQTVSGSDQSAKNRRVEVWVVPKGAAMPGAVKAPKDLPPNFKPARRR